MHDLTGVDLFEIDADAVCISTNGFVTSNGNCVMGRGCAFEAANLFPDVPRTLGTMIRNHSNIVQVVKVIDGCSLVAFPVKHTSGICTGDNVVSHARFKYPRGTTVPGFHLKANMSLIIKSAFELKQLADMKGWKTVALPRVGCGAGELDWNAVKPVLQSMLDDRFIAVTK